MKERKAAWKKTRALRAPSSNGIRIRGNWVATRRLHDTNMQHRTHNFLATRRQGDVGIGSAFDGSQGVDCEDIINIPQIGFGSFQLFPDQNSYGPADPSLSPFNNTVQTGIDWINRQAEVARL
jgi:mannan endo-1,4-beta-mannosidase